jgi:acetyl esterase/lipase
MRTERHRGVAALLLLALPLLATGETAVDRLTVHRDLTYADHDRGRLDVYVPGGAEDAPVVVFVHGGALLFGDKSLVGHVGLRLARAGFVTVAPNHRFSPAVSHPAHVQDAAAAVRWVVDEIGALGGDPDRIVLAGHSSGGYLAGALAADGRWLAAAGVDRARIRGVAPVSGFFFLDRLAPERPKTVWGEDPEGWIDASPAHRADAGTPPALLIAADGDTEARRAEAADFAVVLGELGVDVWHRVVDDRDHRSVFFLMGSEGDATTAALIDFVGRVTSD